MKHWKTVLAALLCAALLACTAAAENEVTTTTDENGHEVTTVTDENGNQTVITEAEPGADDITFDEGELDLDAEEGEGGSDALIAPAPTDAPEESETKGGSVLAWLAPALVAVCAAAAWWFFRMRKPKGERKTDD